MYLQKRDERHSSERQERVQVARRHILGHLGMLPSQKRGAEEKAITLNPNSSPFIPLQAMKPRSRAAPAMPRKKQEAGYDEVSRDCDTRISQPQPTVRFLIRLYIVMTWTAWPMQKGLASASFSRSLKVKWRHLWPWLWVICQSVLLILSMVIKQNVYPVHIIFQLFYPLIQ